MYVRTEALLSNQLCCGSTNISQEIHFVNNIVNTADYFANHLYDQLRFFIIMVPRRSWHI